jgi:hypothetical protein
MQDIPLTSHNGDRSRPLHIGVQHAKFKFRTSSHNAEHNYIVIIDEPTNQRDQKDIIDQNFAGQGPVQLLRSIYSNQIDEHTKR